MTTEPSAGEREGPAPRKKEPSAGERPGREAVGRGPAPRKKEPSAGERDGPAPRNKEIRPLATPFRHLPNAISIMRMVLVVPAGWLLWQNAVAEALALIAIAGFSDAVDGLLARRYNWRTRFGAIADPAADKLLSLVVFVVLAVQGHVPWWLLGIVVGRDLVIVFGAMAYRQVLGNFDVQPTLLSKVNTGLQVVMLLLVVVGLADFGLVSSVAAIVVDPSGFVVVGVSAVASGLHYVVVWSLRAASGIRERREEA